jgi:hypothetical protein
VPFIVFSDILYSLYSHRINGEGNVVKSVVLLAFSLCLLSVPGIAEDIITVHAKSPIVPGMLPPGAVNPIPGALLCHSFDEVETAERLITAAPWRKFQDRITGGAVTLQEGAAPNYTPEAFGCRLVPAGTPMKYRAVMGIPTVSIQVSEGWIAGVTSPDMIAR